MSLCLSMRSNLHKLSNKNQNFFDSYFRLFFLRSIHTLEQQLNEAPNGMGGTKLPFHDGQSPSNSGLPMSMHGHHNNC